jgi:hypothetical protein
MKTKLVAAVSILAIAALWLVPCRATAAGHHLSGVTGQVSLVTPAICLCLQDTDGNPIGECQCPEPVITPMQASVRVYTGVGEGQGHLVAEVQTDAAGHFVVNLRPGNYRLVPVAFTIPFTVPQITTVRVRHGQVTPVKVYFVQMQPSL